MAYKRSSYFCTVAKQRHIPISFIGRMTNVFAKLKLTFFFGFLSPISKWLIKGSSSCVFKGSKDVPRAPQSCVIISYSATMVFNDEWICDLSRRKNWQNLSANKSYVWRIDKPMLRFNCCFQRMKIWRNFTLV